jgi:adenine-specific DNA-methyltransferase
VRKAGGVFYTPEQIVKYICKETIEPFIKGKKPEDISKIKIVDPACGSGSFLIGAYSYLLNYHLDYYTELKRNGKKVPELNVVGKLTNEVKKRILTNNIFGVDLDSNAVEVAKLSLMLKCME